MQITKALCALGQLVSTPGALEALARAEQHPGYFLNRHVTGDWGSELSEEDKAENEYSRQQVSSPISPIGAILHLL